MKYIYALFFSALLICSCAKHAIDIRNYDQDSRIIGVWIKLEKGKTTSEHLEFKKDGNLFGLDYIKGDERLFYTENNNHLHFFVYGAGLKLSKRTYDYYYKIKEDKLYLWFNKSDMLEDKEVTADIYIKKK